MRRETWVMIGLAALSLAVLTGAWAQRDFLLYRFGAVEPEVLYRSELLDTGQLSARVEEHGIRTIVNLTHQQEADLAVSEALGLNYVSLETTQVPPAEHVDRFLEVMADPANYPVLIHCEHGSGRTGVMAAIYRMEHQAWDRERAIGEARRWSHWGSFQPGTPKEVFLRAYQPAPAANTVVASD